jgi:hypothetical protein
MCVGENPGPVSPPETRRQDNKVEIPWPAVPARLWKKPRATLAEADRLQLLDLSQSTYRYVQAAQCSQNMG